MSPRTAFRSFATVPPLSSESGEGRLVYGAINASLFFGGPGLLVAEGSNYMIVYLRRTLLSAKKTAMLI